MQSMSLVGGFVYVAETLVAPRLRPLQTVSAPPLWVPCLGYEAKGKATICFMLATAYVNICGADMQNERVHKTREN